MGKGFLDCRQLPQGGHYRHLRIRGAGALQGFLERLICYAWWPWGQAAPKGRRERMPRKKEVLVTSTAMPAVMARFCTGAMKSLKMGADVVGAGPVATLYFGLSAGGERQILNERMAARARRAGAKIL